MRSARQDQVATAFVMAALAGVWVFSSAPSAPATVPPAPSVSAASAAAWEDSSLRIDAWDATFPVVPVGLTGSGALVPPTDLESVGWWSDGAAPGATDGTVVLAVHRDSVASGAGPFAQLESLPDGSVVTVDGSSYRLTSLQTYDKTSLPVEDLFDQDASAGLVIVTCGGDFDPVTGWDSNVVADFDLVAP